MSDAHKVYKFADKRSQVCTQDKDQVHIYHNVPFYTRSLSFILLNSIQKIENSPEQGVKLMKIQKNEDEATHAS